MGIQKYAKMILSNGEIVGVHAMRPSLAIAIIGKTT